MTSHLFPFGDVQRVCNFISDAQQEEVIEFIGTQEEYWKPLGKAKDRLHFGWEYTVGGALFPARPIPPILKDLAVLLDKRSMMAMVDQVIITKYPAGARIGPHIDRLPVFGPEFKLGFGPVVVSISLLSPAIMRFSHEQFGRGPDIVLDPCSALAMRGEARRAWRHEILKVPELRISLTFRTVIPVP